MEEMQFVYSFNISLVSVPLNYSYVFKIHSIKEQIPNVISENILSKNSKIIATG